MAQSKAVLIGGGVGAAALVAGGLIMGISHTPPERSEATAADPASAAPAASAIPTTTTTASSAPTADAATGNAPVGLTIEHDSAGSGGGMLSTVWAVPLSVDLLGFPAEVSRDPELTCDMEPGGLLDCSAPQTRSMCTPAQTAWLEERAIPREEFIYSEEGAVATQELLLRNEAGSAATAVDSMAANVVFTPVMEDHVMIVCIPHPYAAGGAGGPSLARSVQVPVGTGQVLFGEENPYGDTTMMGQPEGSPVVVNLQPGDTARIKPHLTVPGSGFLSGSLSMSTDGGGERSTLEVPLHPGQDKVLVVPSNLPNVFVSAGSLCPPSGGQAPDPELCTLDGQLHRLKVLRSEGMGR